MGCDKVDLGGFTAIVCRRGGRRRAASCGLPGCDREHTRLCAFELSGTRSHKTCDAKQCDGHATNVGPERDYCPAHAKQMALAT